MRRGFLRGQRLAGLLLLAGLACATPSAAQSGNKATIAVLPFELAGPIVSEGRPFETDVLTDVFSRVLVNTRKFVVADRARLERVRREQRFSGSGLVDPATSARVGRLLGAQYLVVGKVLDYSIGAPREMAYGSGWTRPVRISTEVQVIDSSSGQIVSATKAAATAQTRISSPADAGGIPRAALEKAAEEVAHEALLTIVSVAYPVKVLAVGGQQVTLNRGADGGLEVGTVLRCFGAGKALIDPDTKENLGKQETLAGRVRVDEVLAKTTVASVLGEGDVVPGQSCRLDEDAAEEAGTHRAPPPSGPIHAY